MRVRRSKGNRPARDVLTRSLVSWAAMTHCSRCGAEFEIPPSLTPEQRAEVVARAREPGRVFEAVKLLASRAGVPIRDAKATVLHLALAGPTCHRCRSVVASQSVTQCAKCRSLVINW